MGRMIIDAAASLDGYWADGAGNRVIHNTELQGTGLSGRLIEDCGAVVMSRRSFDLTEDTQWIGQAYASQTPIFVVDEGTADCRRHGFQFLPTYAEAFRAAQSAAGLKAVLVVGEGEAVRAAILMGEADDIWLRLFSRELGNGAPLFEDGINVDHFYVSEMETTPSAVHMHLERRLTA